MSRCIALRARAYGYTAGGGGHLWAYLNWALGLSAAGCEVLWVELVDPRDARLAERVGEVQERLRPYGLADRVVVCGAPVPPGSTALPEDALDAAELIVDPGYDTPARVLRRCGRSALVDIDPGQLQVWWSGGHVDVAPHDVHFTIGERIGAPGSRVPDCGVEWHHTPPPVALDAWPATAAPAGAPFTTVTHWTADEWFVHDGTWFDNSKRRGFEPYLDLPAVTGLPLELALAGADDERRALEERGWRVLDSWSAAGTPEAYADYVRSSRAEFSCAKPAYVELGNAWISDRTLCYLASGRPAVVQDTGPSELLSGGEGLLRFSDPEGAASALRAVAEDLEHHARAARRLAEEAFDARRVVSAVLDRALA